MRASSAILREERLFLSNTRPRVLRPFPMMMAPVSVVRYDIAHCSSTKTLATHPGLSSGASHPFEHHVFKMRHDTDPALQSSVPSCKDRGGSGRGFVVTGVTGRVAIMLAPAPDLLGCGFDGGSATTPSTKERQLQRQRVPTLTRRASLRDRLIRVHLR